MTARARPYAALRVVATLSFTALLVTACSDSSPAACGSIITEEFDTQSSLHVAPDTDVEFLTWPPTSGPHLSGAAPEGVVTEPMSGALQVSALEGGKVLVQHEGLSDSDVARLQELAGANVVVAPGTDLPDRVVLTAWTTKQICTDVDRGAHRDFIEIYALAEAVQ